MHANFQPDILGRLWEHRRSRDSGGGEHVPIPPKWPVKTVVVGWWFRGNQFHNQARRVHSQLKWGKFVRDTDFSSDPNILVGVIGLGGLKYVALITLNLGKMSNLTRFFSPPALTQRGRTGTFANVQRTKKLGSFRQDVYGHPKRHRLHDFF